MAAKSTRGLSFSVDRLLQPVESSAEAKRRDHSSSSGGSSTSSSPPSSPLASAAIGAPATTPPVFLATARAGQLAPRPSGIMTLNATFPFPLTLPFSAGGSTGTLCAATNWSPTAFSSWSLTQAGGGGSHHHGKIAGQQQHAGPAVNWPAVGLSHRMQKTQHHFTPAKRIFELPKGSTPLPASPDEIEDLTGGEDDSDTSSPGPSSSEHGGLDEGEAGSSRAEKKYKKKKRTTFTSSQLQQLETRFNQQKYLTKLDRCRMAQSLGLTEKHIKTWYQNRRTKWKRECTDEMWSRERENAAANMYTQHLQLKSMSGSAPLSIP